MFVDETLVFFGHISAHLLLEAFFQLFLKICLSIKIEFDQIKAGIVDSLSSLEECRVLSFLPMIKSTLSSLPPHVLFVYFPANVANSIEML